MWPKEEIPLQDKLFIRVHKQNINPKTGLPRPAAFKNTPASGPSLSSDWERYTTPEKSRELIGKQYKKGTTDFKNPLFFFIVSVIVKNIYNLNCNQLIEHTPKYQNPEPIGDPNNRAHSSITGDKTDEEIRLKFVNISNWEIKP